MRTFAESAGRAVDRSNTLLAPLKMIVICVLSLRLGHTHISMIVASYRRDKSSNWLDRTMPRVWKI